MMLIDIDPLAALRHYYEGERLGVWQGDVRKNEKQRKLLLPSMLKDFLQDYGYFSVNSSDSHCFQPDDMPIIHRDDGDLVVFARWNGAILLAFRRIDFAADNPRLYYGEYIGDAENETENEPQEDDELVSWNFLPSPHWRLRDFLIMLIINNLRKRVWNDETPDGLQESGAPDELLDLLRGDFPEPSNILCWDNEEEQLWAIGAPVGGPRQVCRFIANLTTWEIRTIFNQYFFQKQDFARALPWAQRLIGRLELVDENMVELAEAYKLAARCHWAEEHWEAAKAAYQKAEQIFNKQLNDLLEKAKYFYQAKGNFYKVIAEEAESQQAFAQVDKICEFLGQGGARARGMRLVQQAMEIAGKNTNLVDDLGTLQYALELYEQALAEYQQEPRDCKYDIARCQQLKGDLRKKIKQLNRQKNN